MGKHKNVRKLFEQALMTKYMAKQSKGYEVPDVLKELMSPASLEIISHFGIDAPDLLNNYCISLEDALIEQVRNAADYRQKCMMFADEVSRLRELVSDEDKLPS